MPKVYIVNGNQQYRDMFLGNGWYIATDHLRADLVQFTGGEDVDPALYGRKPEARTHFNTRRDIQETFLYHTCLSNKIPMAGICRGGQFLHVMNGGKLRQHVDNHGIQGTHPVYLKQTNSFVECTSTHHQQFIWDWTIRDSYLLGYHSDRLLPGVEEGNCEAEIILYDATQSLCFQPHPEFYKGPCQNLYMNLLRSELGLG